MLFFFFFIFAMQVTLMFHISFNSCLMTWLKLVCIFPCQKHELSCDPIVSYLPVHKYYVYVKH